MEELEGIYEPPKRKPLDDKGKKVKAQIRVLARKFLRENDRFTFLEKQHEERQESLLEKMRGLAKNCKHLNHIPKSTAYGTMAVWYCADCCSRLKEIGRKQDWVFEPSEMILNELFG